MKSEQQSNAPWDSPGRVARKRKRLQSCYYGDCAVKPHNKRNYWGREEGGGVGVAGEKGPRTIAGYSPAFCQVAPTIHRYPVILQGGERHCDES